MPERWGMAPRAYSSSIRDAQVEQTREHLLTTARDLLQTAGLEALTLPRLAQAAGVSAPTVYRHFPTLDDLFRAFLEWIRPRIGQTTDNLARRAADLPNLPLENFPSFEAHASVLQPLMDSTAWNKIRVASAGDRARRTADAVRAAWPDGDPRGLESAAAAIYVLASPQTWRWMRDTWGLDTETAAGAASWAMRLLVEAVAAGDVPGKRKPKPKRKPR